MLILIVAVGLVWTFFSITSYTPVRKNEEEIKSRSLVEELSYGVDNLKSEALSGIFKLRRVYIIPEGTTVAPVPVKTGYGVAADQQEMREVIARAEQSGLVSASDMIFPGRDIVPRDNEPMQYYYDDSIIALMWKTLMDGDIYNFCEIVIAHPSQFRRYLTDDTFGSNRRATVSTMSRSVNAVVGMSADFYGYRGAGVVVYNHQLFRSNVSTLDNCFIDDNGDLQLVKRQTIDAAGLQPYIDDNNINFSLSFGPILVEDGKLADNISVYALGEVKDHYSRAAIGQLGKLHYLLCTIDGGARYEGVYYNGNTALRLGEQMLNMGCWKAYTIDGGQTATLTLDSMIYNRVGYGNERPVSDFIYFATAIPDTQRTEAE